MLVYVSGATASRQASTMLGAGAAATDAVYPAAEVAAAAVAAAVAAAAGEKRGHHWAKCWTNIEQTAWLRKYNSFLNIRANFIDFVISTSCMLYYTVISNKSCAMKIANFQKIFFGTFEMPAILQSS